MKTKVCRDCGECKHITSYHKTGRSDLNRRCLYCKPCAKVRNAAHYQANLEERRAGIKRWREEHPHYWASSTYGISEDEVQARIDAQNGVCAICKRPESWKDGNGNVKRLAFDHCHQTGELRGLLCQACNMAIGNMQDDVERLENAIEYLRLYQFCAA